MKKSAEVCYIRSGDQEVGYELDLLSEAAIHNVFRITQLKKKVGQRMQTQQHPLVFTEEFELQFMPEDILGVRQHSKLVANE